MTTITDYGTVEFEGKKYVLDQDAYLSDTGVYRAAATCDGRDYLVEWHTTEWWDKTEKCWAIGEEKQRLAEHDEELSSCQEEELAELIAEGYDPAYCPDDESDACDWDNPSRVIEV